MRRYRILILSVIVQIAFWGFANYSLYRAKQINRQTSAAVDDLGKKVTETKRIANEAESVCKARVESEAPKPEIKPCRPGQSLGPGESCGLVIPIAPVSPARDRLPKS